jgi:hypothetical protein
MKKILFSMAVMLAIVSSCSKSKTEQPQVSEPVAQDTIKPANAEQAKETKSDSLKTAKITPELAYEGINNYCHKEFDWSPAEENPSIMYVAMGDETETEYKVIFRSYTGSFTYFYVNKKTGKTRIEEFVPALDITQESGTLHLVDYVKREK